MVELFSRIYLTLAHRFYSNINLSKICPHFGLGPVVTELEALTGIETRRIHVDKGYRGRNHAQKFRVWSGAVISSWRRRDRLNRGTTTHLAADWRGDVLHLAADPTVFSR
jgi:hypothetical protein